MHDIDRVRLEAEFEAGAFETGEFEAEQFEFAETGEVFGETQNMELASELLEVSSESELEQFLGDLVAKAGQSLGRIVGSPSGQALIGILKSAARKVLPSLGSSMGRYIGGDEGARLGGQAASAAGRAFGLELEGLSNEDREFEIARRYVNFAGEAVRNLSETLAQTQGPGQSEIATGSSLNAALAAANAAAKTHAPGLLQTPAAMRLNPPSFAHARDGAGGATGRWVRHGSNIVLYGV
jgi:hypothetical protein